MSSMRVTSVIQCAVGWAKKDLQPARVAPKTEDLASAFDTSLGSFQEFFLGSVPSESVLAMGGGVHDGVMVQGALPAMSGEPMVCTVASHRYHFLTDLAHRLGGGWGQRVANRRG